MLQADYERGTKDGDVLESQDLTPEIRRGLLALGGRNTTLHRRNGIYLDIVFGALPFLPQRPRWHPQPALTETLRGFSIETLDIVDVVVSKLARFDANDQHDIEAMVERERVPHESLIERFRAAVDFLIGDAREVDLPEYVSNLNRVERDVLLVPETEIELPSWIA